MAKGINFPEANKIFGKPSDMTDEECYSLNTWVGKMNDQPVITSQWQFSPEEIQEINKTGKVWLNVNGYGMPPVVIYTGFPFIGRSECVKILGMLQNLCRNAKVECLGDNDELIWSFEFYQFDDPAKKVMLENIQNFFGSQFKNILEISNTLIHVRTDIPEVEPASSVIDDPEALIPVVVISFDGAPNLIIDEDVWQVEGGFKLIANKIEQGIIGLEAVKDVEHKLIYQKDFPKEDQEWEET